MKDKFSLENKNILISGASSGIGASCARICSDYGAKVILLGRNKNRLEEVRMSLTGNGHLLRTINLKELNEIEKVISDAVNAVGPISGFIHSAGLHIIRPLNALTIGDFLDLYEVNVIAGMEISKILLKKKYRADTVSLVFISSIMGIVSDSGLICYSCSKGALISGVKALAAEYAKKNVRVNCISPGIVETQMAKNLFSILSEEQQEYIKRRHLIGLGKPEDVAYACVFLLSDAARWITGINLIVDGGFCAR